MDKHIGAQYYTIRDYIKTIEDFDQSCQKIRDIGYSVVQISGCPLGAREMREVLDKHGLKVVTTHRGFDDFRNNLDEIIEYNKTLGVKLCGVGSLGMAAPTMEEVKSFIADANQICEKLAQEDMYFGYHNHSFEFEKLDGKTIFEYLVEETDRERFRFIVDTYWLQMGGKTPQDVIRSLGKRAMAVHFKDLAVYPDDWRHPQYAEIGEGNLDWDAIIAACEEAGTEWALVEQDACRRNPFESLEISYNYLKTKGFC